MAKTTDISLDGIQPVTFDLIDQAGLAHNPEANSVAPMFRCTPGPNYIGVLINLRCRTQALEAVADGILHNPLVDRMVGYLHSQDGPQNPVREALAKAEAARANLTRAITDAEKAKADPNLWHDPEVGQHLAELDAQIAALRSQLPAAEENIVALKKRLTDLDKADQSKAFAAAQKGLDEILKQAHTKRNQLLQRLAEVASPILTEIVLAELLERALQQNLNETLNRALTVARLVLGDQAA